MPSTSYASTSCGSVSVNPSHSVSVSRASSTMPLGIHIYPLCDKPVEGWFNVMLMGDDEECVYFPAE